MERKPTPAAAEMNVRSDSDVAEEEEAPPPLPLTGLLYWCETRGILPPDSAVTPTHNTFSSGTMLSNYCNLMNSSPPIIFPPKNHENLHISSDPFLVAEQIQQIHENNASVDQQYAYSSSDSDSDSISNSMSSSTLFSPSNSTPLAYSSLFSIPKAKPAAISLHSWTRILHTKNSGTMRFIWGLSRGLLWTFRSATITAVLIAYLCFRQRRRLRTVESSEAQLLGIIKEKDEKINQLLHQISRMNQVLMAAAAARLGAGTPSGN